MPMREIDIEKVDESKFVPPDQARAVGYWGYTPDETDDREYTVAAQGPLAEEANRVSGKPGTPKASSTSTPSSSSSSTHRGANK
jgi:hypothetical protein